MVVVVLVFCVLVAFSEGSIYNVKHNLGEHEAIWRMTEGGMYAGRDPNRPGPEGQGEVIVNLTFTRDNSEGDSVVHVLLIRPEQEAMVGYKDPDTAVRSYCCTEELLKADVSGCAKVGELIIKKPRTVKSKPFIFGSGFFTEPIDEQSVSFTKGASQSTYAQTLVIHRTGIYTLMLGFCDDKPTNISLEGQVIFRNSHGYLPGQLYGFVPFYYFLTLAYVVTSFLWLGTCILRRASLHSLHLYMSGVLALGAIEAAVHYFTYDGLNRSGAPICCPLPFGVIAADLISVVKIVPSKILVLLVGMGWGITKESIGEKRAWIVLYGVVSFALSLLHEMVASQSHNDNVPMFITVFVSFPLFLLDVILLIWIFLELRHTRDGLRDRGAFAKDKVFRRFKNALRLFLASVLVWLVWAVYVGATSPKASRWRFMHWRTYFLVGGVPPGGVMWDLLFFCLLVLTMILFFPGNQFTELAYRPEDDLSVNVGLTAMADFGEDSSADEN